MKRGSLVIGNWKMNGSASEVDHFAAALKGAEQLPCEVGVCVPFVYIERMARAVAGSQVVVGGQDVADRVDPGALTGAVNARMLGDVGAGDVIVGHSERRSEYGETDQNIVAKVGAALEAGVRPIVCVGETKQQRDAGHFQQVVDAQLDAVLSSFESRELASLVVAYEPVWAIGTGDTATPEEAEEAHSHIRGRVAAYNSELADGCRIIYGGSVKPDNAADIFRQDNVDGALVGGASLNYDSFAAIAAASVEAEQQNKTG
ncbi:triose-phosphate isomerase [Salinisphaera sp. USBA-960]|uniref:triose-phosphate isomerase n=1 Tax=Salinisphaera orenii TaxID=856731 RepID=UPI000DBEA15C|nr:triose-phosphate isomerase [Salifodinibacter halophilus]NNC25535.1 triose-phosphate isomerase [Salifodinibacter halophilus]